MSKCVEADRSHDSRPMRVAVVGAGLAGLSCARRLARAHRQVVVFEAEEEPGGRLRGMAVQGQLVDIGAQYFTARDPRFQALVEDWHAAGLVARWPLRLGRWTAGRLELSAASETRYAGTPVMAAIASGLGAGLRVRYGTPIREISRSAQGWRLHGEQGWLAGRFDTVVVATPPTAAARLLAAVPRLAASAAQVRTTHCWALAARFSAPLDTPADGIFIDHPALAWASRDSSRPNRDRNTETWVLHAQPQWSRQHRDLPPHAAAELLLNSFAELLNQTLPLAAAQARLWPTAATINPLAQGYLLDRTLQLGVCGDWCHGSRIESAFLSGLMLAEALPQANAD